MKYLIKLRGWIRHFWGFCPACNSDAPKMYDCEICNWDTTYPPKKQTKKDRWKRFINQINLS